MGSTLPSAAHRPPKLALVLGSGGVRSVAALGVAQALGEAGLVPQLVAGCSSGALFGACIAMGWSGRSGLDAALRFWSPELTRKRRWRAYLEIVAPRLAGFGAEFALRDARSIRERIEQAFGDTHFEDLPIPLRVAVTATASGESAVLERGRVADALRASMALPFLFPSVEIDGQRFMDGVLSDPLPVALAAHATAIVTVGFRGVMPRRVDRAGRLVAQVTTAMINNLQAARLRAAQEAGARILTLDIDVDRRVGLWDTAAMPRIFELGCEAARARVSEIRRLLEVPLAA